MICTRCGFETEALPCEVCDEEGRTRRLVRDFGLTRGIPTTGSEVESFDQAMKQLRSRLDAEEFEGQIKFKQEDVLYSPAWWYIPFTRIGCSGFIVSRLDGHVNWLGSSNSLADCFWAQNHGITADETDFIIEHIEDYDGTLIMVRNFTHPDSFSADSVRYYSATQAAAALDTLPAAFLAYRLWFNFELIRDAATSGAFRFSARPSPSSKRA